MSAGEWLVVLAGAASLGWVNWYFFLTPDRGSEAVPREGDVEEE